MEQLIKDTTAYKIFSGDIKSGKVSHAYMLHFQDAKNMRAVLKLFAAEFFRADKFSPLGQRILNEKGIGAWVDYWGYDCSHDWPWWYKQVEYFLPYLLE